MSYSENAGFNRAVEKPNHFKRQSADIAILIPNNLGSKDEQHFTLIIRLQFVLK